MKQLGAMFHVTFNSLWNELYHQGQTWNMAQTECEKKACREACL